MKHLIITIIAATAFILGVALGGYIVAKNLNKMDIVKASTYIYELRDLENENINAAITEKKLSIQQAVDFYTAYKYISTWEKLKSAFIFTFKDPWSANTADTEKMISQSTERVSRYLMENPIPREYYDFNCNDTSTEKGKESCETYRWIQNNEKNTQRFLNENK